jgi:PAS domain S-box-containing protein
MCATNMDSLIARAPERSGTEFLSGGGELSGLIANHDWSSTPLGPVESWPQSLKTTVSLMLNSQHPMWVGWGPQATFLYNDAYISVLSHAKHPWALGRPASVVWAEIWDVCGPLADRVFQQGQASFQDDVRLFMKRADYTEEVFYSFSYSPIRGESGGVGGLFCPSAETTARVIGARRLRTLSELAAQALVKGSVDEACNTALATISHNPDDVPFALLYLADGNGGLRLASSCNLARAPDAVHAAVWSAHEVFAARAARTVLAPGVPGLPIGLANQPVQHVRVLPVSRSSDEQPLGVFVAAISPARPLDTDYEVFFDLMASQLASTIQNARAAEETRARAERLAELDRAKTVFFSNVSHELRTPLTLMLGPLQELVERRGDAAVTEPASLALRNARRLHRLVNTLLDFSRIEAGRIRARYVPTDLGAVTADLASTFRSAVEKAGMRLEVRSEPIAEPVYVDREMWEKIVVNLVSNAFKYTLEGTITVEVQGAPGRAVLRVTDTGSGIPAEELPRLFERFHRVQGMRARTHEGTGIGLALVHELVRLHGGTIEVDSTVGRGSVFEVRIPTGKSHLAAEHVKDDDEQDSRAGIAQAYVTEALGWLGDDEPVPAVPAAAPGARIVLADDNRDMRDYIARLLRQQGYRVDAVGDGRAALELVRAARPDLVVTDVMMPVMDGFELLKALRSAAHDTHIPVIMLSARAGEEARIEGLQAGADDYLTKPFSARELVARVGSTITVAQVRRQALETERRLRQESINILESIKEGFIALDRDWRFTYANAEAERLNGMPRETMLGRNHWEVFPHALGTEVEANFRKVMSERVPAHFESFYAPWSRWFETSCYPINDGGIAVYFRDITERKLAQEDAREADRRKDEFIATLAHELRNPLAPIRTGLQVLRRTADTALLERTRDVMDRQVSHMVRLVDDLLDVSRISRGKIELRKERVRLRDVVDSALETSRPLLDANRHELFVSLPTEDVWLDADPTRMAQAISNLLNNAAKYTPEGGRVTLKARAADGELNLSVTDTGAGIPAHLLPRVFDLFMQGETTLDRSQGGLGIGLTLVKQLVQMHGGEVTAASDGPGRGSTFTMTIPVASQPASAVDAGMQEPRERAKPLKVLVADDNVDAADTLSMLLELMGHRCIAVHDGASAIAAFEKDRPDVVLLDIGMPGMDGYEVARRLRSLQGSARPRIMALTGWGAVADRVKSKDAGFDVHLTKPVEYAALQSALRGN